MLRREVKKICMSCENSYISQFFELGWYDWIYLIDNAVQFPYEKLVLGRHLRPIIDIGSTITSKILMQHDEVVHIFTYHALTPEEIDIPK